MQMRPQGGNVGRTALASSSNGVRRCARMGSPAMPVNAPKVRTSRRAGPSTSIPLKPNEDSGSAVGSAVVPTDRSVSGLVPAPPQQNVVTKFLREALKCPTSAKAITNSTRMDIAQYFEKRRVQNALRRLFEALQERFGLDGDAGAEELGAAFHSLVQHARSPGTVDNTEEVTLDEQQFFSGLEALGVWSPELNANDHSEIFAAFLVPTSAAARAVLEGEPMRTTCTRSTFCEGFERMPFNLPDFPVPVHLLPPSLQESNKSGPHWFSGEQTDAVAEAVATTFSMEKTGLNRVRDFFLCGLVSLEEIQMALPRLVPHFLVEDAVARIVRMGAPQFTDEEWNKLIVGVRNNGPQEASGSTPVPDMVAPLREAAPAPLSSPQCSATIAPQQHALPGMVSLASPPIRNRELLAPAGSSRSADRGADRAPDVPRPAEPLTAAGPVGSATREARECNDIDPEVMSRFRSRFEPVTEPLLCRDLRSEEPVSFMRPEVEEAPPAPSPPAPRRVVDWSTASRGGGVGTLCSTRGSHQADEGAGARLSWGTSGFKKELAAALSKAIANETEQAANNSTDYLAWVSLDLHHECGGPFLARAFVRCCQLYERRKAKDAGAQ